MDRRVDTLAPYLFILPFVIIFGIFWVYPILWGPWMSFHEFDLTGESTFIGLQNYYSLLSPGSQLLTVTFNTFIVAAIVIPVQVILGLLFAILLNQAYLKFKTTFRNLYLIPIVFSTTALALIGVMFFERSGLINLWLGTEIPWLSHPWWSKVAVGVVLIWKRTGLAVLIFLAGLQGIPQHLYKAAKVDGANRYQQFRYITLPQLRPMTVLVLILTTAYTLKMFATPYVLTQGGPGNATKSIVMLLYERSFRELSFGEGAAIGVLFSILLATIMVVQYIIGQNKNE